MKEREIDHLRERFKELEARFIEVTDVYHKYAKDDKFLSTKIKEGQKELISARNFYYRMYKSSMNRLDLRKKKIPSGLWKQHEEVIKMTFELPLVHIVDDWLDFLSYYVSQIKNGD